MAAPDGETGTAPFGTAIAEWFATPIWGPLTQAVIIIAVAAAVRFALQLVIRRVVNRIVLGAKAREGVDDTAALSNSPITAVRLVQRTRTLGTVLGNVVTWVIVAVAGILLLQQVFLIEVGAIVASAGFVTAGLAFGAQNVVRDLLTGLFMVAEDQLGVGDIVDLGPATGVVESVGLRVTALRDVNGTLWYVRNGEITRVGNMSLGWTRVITDLAVPLEADLDEVQRLALATADSLTTDPKWRRRIIDKPELWGLHSIADDLVVVRVVVKTTTSSRDEVGRELRARLKHDIEAAGIQLPKLEGVILSGWEGAGSVRGARPPRTKPVRIEGVGARPAREPGDAGDNGNDD